MAAVATEQSPARASLRLPAPLLALLEHALNKAISLDVSGAPDLTALHGKTIAIELSGLEVTAYARIFERRVRLQSQVPPRIHATITGSPLALARLGWVGDRAGILQGDVTLSGDMDVARALQKLLAAADIDLEEELSRHVGDVLAHQIGNTVRGMLRWGREAVRRLELDGGEYLVEEKNLLPARCEITGFLDDVDTLRADLDRLEQRCQRLRASMISPS